MPPPAFERLSKRAVIISAVAIAALQIGIHPDMTPGLRLLCTLSAVAGWLAGGSSKALVQVVWVCAGVLAPAILRLAAGREGPVLDSFWMTGLTAALLRSSSWSRWSLDAGTRTLAAGWGLTIALAWPILSAREAGFDWRLLFDHGAINSWSGWSAPHAVAWIGFVAWAQLLGLLWLDWLTARLDADPARRLPAVIHGFWIAGTLASLVGIYQSVFDLEFLNTSFWAARLRASGTLLDANAFGICAGLAGPSAVLAFHASRWRRAAPVTALIVAINLAGLWTSGSRTAAICGLVAAAGAAVALRGAVAPARRTLILGAGGAAIVVIAGVMAAGGAIGPAGRLFDRYDDSTQSFIGTAFNREPYGPMANEIIHDYPLTGIGLGSYQQLAPDYWRRRADQALPFDHAQNWWRHQAAELGLLGGLTLFLWSAVLAWRVLASRPLPERTFEATVTRGMLLAIGLGSLIQIPTQTPVVLLWFFTLVAWLPFLIVEARPLPVSWRPVAALAVVYAASQFALARGPLAVAERAKTFAHEYVVGAYRAEATEDQGQFRWTDDESRFVWPARTRWMVIHLWAHHPDVGRNPVHVTMTTPCGLLAEQDLADSERVSIGIILPEGQRSLDITFRVSRTWQPSSLGEADQRHLGIGIAADSVATRELATATHVPVELEACPAGL